MDISLQSGVAYPVFSFHHAEIFTSDERCARGIDKALKAEKLDYCLWKKGGIFRAVARIRQKEKFALCAEIALQGVTVQWSLFSGAGYSVEEANAIRAGVRLMFPAPEIEHEFLGQIGFKMTLIKVE